MCQPACAPALGLRAGEVFHTIPQTVQGSKTMTRLLSLLSQYVAKRRFRDGANPAWPTTNRLTQTSLSLFCCPSDTRPDLNELHPNMDMAG